MTEPDPPAWLADFTADKVKDAMGVPVVTPQDTAWLADSVAWVREYALDRQRLNGLADARVLWAAKLHAMRLFNRRGSSGASSASFDSAAAASSTAEDYDLLLAYRANFPRVG